MIDFLEIQKVPTSISREELQQHVVSGCAGVHESVLRSYQVLQQVKRLLSKGVPPDIISELIEVMESKP